jgi:MerR family regulatory protein
MAEETLSIGEVADRVGISVSAIRFYERRELLPEPERVGGQRLPLHRSHWLRCQAQGVHAPLGPLMSWRWRT